MLVDTVSMERDFFCPECRAEHASPAFADLGYRVICLDCALGVEIVILAPVTRNDVTDPEPTFTERAA